MSPPKETALPILACPDCHEILALTVERNLVCHGCSTEYQGHDGIAQLIGSKSKINFSELQIQDEVSALYENVRYTVDTSVRYHHDALVDVIKFANPSGDLLEVGCGNGSFLEMLISQEKVKSLSAIDLSNEMLKYANSRMCSTERDIPWRITRGDGERLPFNDASFDCVFARGLLHHLPSPKKGASEIARVLRPNGTAVLVDPYRNPVSAIPRLISRRTSHFDADHKNFSLRELKKIFTDKLEIEEVKFWGYLAYPLLGFPDVIDFNWLPLQKLYQPLVNFDNGVSKIPLINRLSWGITVKVARIAE
ncbi:MAG: methyltransferase domain-containing protein [Actinomycetota bacterium]